MSKYIVVVAQDTDGEGVHEQFKIKNQKNIQKAMPLAKELFIKGFEEEYGYAPNDVKVYLSDTDIRDYDGDTK